MILTNHATKRISKRMGIPKKAVQKVADEASLYGMRRSEISGSLRRYIDRLMWKDKGANNAVVYNKFIFIMRGEVVITAWLLPKQYKNRHELNKGRNDE